MRTVKSPLHGLKNPAEAAVFTTVASTAAEHSESIRAIQTTYGSSVLDASIQTPVPERGVDILNKLFEIYNTDDVNEKNQLSVQTMRFIDDRLAVVEGQLDSVNRNIMDYKARESVTDLGGQASMYFATVTDLDKRNTTLDLQMEVLQDVQRYVNGIGREPGTVPSLMMVNDPILSSLLTQLYAAEFDLDKAKAIAGNQSESVQLAEEKISRIKMDLRENMENIRILKFLYLNCKTKTKV